MCLKEIFQKNGFDSPKYLSELTEVHLNSLEDAINQNRTILGYVSTGCEHMQFYNDNSRNFMFLPGHRLFLLQFSKSVHLDVHSNISFEHPAFSILLQNMIQTALNNHGISSSNNRYPELLMDFAIYVYITAGKASYEVISANLPMSSAVTIGNKQIT